jgi:hypothetical protein
MPFPLQDISKCKAVVKFVKKSNQTTYFLTQKRKIMGVSRGLVSFGKTRFATSYHSCSSVLRCHPPLQALVESGIIAIKVRLLSFLDAHTDHCVAQDMDQLFKKGWPATMFTSNLERYCNITGPIAKAITLLGSTHSTPSDVYVLYLAIGAAFNDVLSDSGRSGLSITDTEQIRSIYNKRYKQMIDDAPHDVYFSSFILDPRKWPESCLMFMLTDKVPTGYRKANILRDLNPLRLKNVKVGGSKSTSPEPESLLRSQKFLVDRLKNACVVQYSRDKSVSVSEAARLQAEKKLSHGVPIRPFWMEELADREALTLLKEQLRKFVKGLSIRKSPEALATDITDRVPKPTQSVPQSFSRPVFLNLTKPKYHKSHATKMYSNVESM